MPAAVFKDTIGGAVVKSLEEVADMASEPRVAVSVGPHLCLRLRRAEQTDVDAIWDLKRRLQITVPGGRTVDGGFLLGVSRSRYAELVAHANVWVLEQGRGIVGFAVTLPDRVLRASDLWSRRAGISWSAQAPVIDDDARVGYFDQIACAPGRASRMGAPALALRALLDLVVTGHQHVFATVVREPVHNVAALHLLEAIGARHAGRLAEHHEDVGVLVSDLYHLDRSGSAPPSPWDDTPLGRKIQRMIARMS